MPRTARDVVFVDGVRTPFGKAGPKGIYHETRADDLVVKCIRELLRRNPAPRSGADRRGRRRRDHADRRPGPHPRPHRRHPRGLPESVPGYSIDRMCAGAHDRGHHHRRRPSPSARTTWSWPAVSSTWAATRWARASTPTRGSSREKLVDESALFMGMTAENLHDRFPHLTKERADEYAVRSQEKAAKAYANGAIQQDLVPISVRRTTPEGGETGWGLATADEPMRPGTTLEQLAGLKTPFRAHGRVTAGQRRRAQRRRHRLAARRRGRRPRAGPAGQDAPGRLLLRRRRARGDGLSARSRRPRRRSPRRA